MNRQEARIEYEHILNDAIDWLRDGYRREQVGEESAATNPEINAAARSSQNNELGMPHNGVEGSNLDFQFSEARKISEDETSSTSRHWGKLGRIAKEISQCESCNLCLTRENTVPGIGTKNPLLMIVTAAPTFDARETDGPLPPYEFDYLDKWLKALNLQSSFDTFITPAVKCRTPGGRPPNADESAKCFRHLERQFVKLKPRAILALGAAACGALTGDISKFPSLVGKMWIWREVPSLVLWTPAEVLENPARLRKPVWDALQKLRDAWNALPGTGV